MDEAGYRQFAELEEDHWWFRARRRIFLHLLDRLVPPGSHWRILDVGCGAGNVLRRLGRYGSTVGLEPSAVLAGLAHERGCPAITRGSALEMPFPEGSLDLVCLFDTLEHMPEEHEALVEVRRVLRPGGLALVSVPAYRFLWTNNDRVAHHWRRYTAGQLRASLERAGLEPVRTTYFNTLLFPAILVAIGVQKLKERFVGLSRADETNLTRAIPGPLARLLCGVMASERHWLAAHRFPTGHSLIGLARRPPGPLASAPRLR